MKKSVCEHILTLISLVLFVGIGPGYLQQAEFNIKTDIPMDGYVFLTL